MATMKGSEKQVAWAKDIRKNMTEAIKNNTEITIKKRELIDLFNENIIDTNMIVSVFEEEEPKSTMVRIKGENMGIIRDENAGLIGEYKVWLET